MLALAMVGLDGLPFRWIMASILLSLLLQTAENLLLAVVGNEAKVTVLVADLYIDLGDDLDAVLGEVLNAEFEVQLEDMFDDLNNFGLGDRTTNELLLNKNIDRTSSTEDQSTIYKQDCCRQQIRKGKPR